MSDEIVEDIIYPPTAEELEDLRSHKVGLAIRLASKLGRPLTQWEYDMFKKEPPKPAHKLVELPNGKIGIA